METNIVRRFALGVGPYFALAAVTDDEIIKRIAIWSAVLLFATAQKKAPQEGLSRLQVFKLAYWSSMASGLTLILALTALKHLTGTCYITQYPCRFQENP